MKRILSILIVLSIYGCSQKLTISGTVDSGKYDATVINNDTSCMPKTTNMHARFNSRKYLKYITITQQGRFTIKAKRSDSLTFISTGFKQQVHCVNDLLKKKYIHIKLEEIPCDTIKCQEKPKLYAVVANKISLKWQRKENCRNIISLDSRFKAVYNVQESLYGDFKKDTIHFIVYDHYDAPAFAEYDNVLLFISNACGNNHHVKYQYAPVYKTADGRWAAPYMSSAYQRLKSDVVKPEMIPFEPPVVYTIRDDADPKWLLQMYPEPYYHIEGNKATAVFGNYLPEIMKLKQETILKDLGF